MTKRDSTKEKNLSMNKVSDEEKLKIEEIRQLKDLSLKDELMDAVKRDVKKRQTSPLDE